MSELIIRPMTAADADRKGYVHWKSSVETYTGLMDPDFLARSTLEIYGQIAAAYVDTTLVAELDGQIVGFGCWSADGEISALYILREFQGRGIGRKLMAALLAQLTAHPVVHLWVLHGNDNAIGFYERMGFRLTGESIPNKYSSIHPSLRMTLTRK